MLLNHIYNVSSIVSKLPKSTGDKNVYEKVNQIFKGAAVGSPMLVKQIKDILKEENKNINKYLDEVFAVLGGKEEPAEDKVEVKAETEGKGF